MLNRPGVRTPGRGRGAARYSRGFAPSMLTGAGIPQPRFAARAAGLASGLALAVRPAGLAEAPGSTARRRRVPRSGMRSTVEAGGASPDNARRSGPIAVSSSRRPPHSAEQVRVSYAKVAEYQRRGVVHFHAIIRLDGPALRYLMPGCMISATHMRQPCCWLASPCTCRRPARSRRPVDHTARGRARHQRSAHRGRRYLRPCQLEPRY